MKNPNSKRKFYAVVIAAIVGGLLLVMFNWATGWHIFASHTNPIAGWQKIYNHDPDTAIGKDYQDYIQKLSPEEKKYLGGTDFFEDGTGQHAIVIEVDIKPNAWNHVLIYDKDNKRIKVIKYVAWHYMS
jgi:hypothetical protein